jgi:hypothetical protein
MSGVFRENVARWSKPASALREPFRLGPHSDPNGGQFKVQMSGNRVERAGAD